MTKQVNWQLLTKWSDEKAWFLGATYGDGCLYYNETVGHYSISASGTLQMMTNWSKLISPDVKPAEMSASPGTYQAVLHSKDVVSWFKDTYAICGPKSKTICWPHDMPDEHTISFLRGLWDTDGCLTIDATYENSRNTATQYINNNFLCFIGLNSLKMIEQIKDKLMSVLDLPDNKIIEKIKKLEDGRFADTNYVLKYAGAAALLVARYIYKNAPEHLRNEEKYYKYLQFEEIQKKDDSAKCLACNDKKPQFEGYCQPCWWDKHGRKIGKGTACSNHPEKEVFADGLCNGCYKKRIRSQPGYVEKPTGICACGKPSFRKGMCNACYMKVRRAEQAAKKKQEKSLAETSPETSSN